MLLPTDQKGLMSSRVRTGAGYFSRCLRICSFRYPPTDDFLDPGCVQRFDLVVQDRAPVDFDQAFRQVDGQRQQPWPWPALIRIAFMGPALCCILETFTGHPFKLQ